MPDCDRARYHDKRHVPEAIARTTLRPPTVCVCGRPEQHDHGVGEDVCYDCLVNRLTYWWKFWDYEALAGQEADVASAERKATAYPAVNALVGGVP